MLVALLVALRAGWPADLVGAVRREGHVRQDAGLHGFRLREAGALERDLHQVRDQDREADAVGERGAVGVDQEPVADLVAPPFLEQERAGIAVGEDVVAARLVVEGLDVGLRAGLVEDEQVRELDVPEEGRVAAPVHHLASLAADGDQVLEVAGHEAEAQARGRADRQVGLLVGDREVVGWLRRPAACSGEEPHRRQLLERVAIRAQRRGHVGPQGPAHRQLQVRHVVRRQRVEAARLERGLQQGRLAARDDERDALGPALGDDHAFLGEGLALVAHQQLARRLGVGRALDADEDAPVAIARACGVEGGDPDVGAAGREPLVVELERQLDVRALGEVAVREQQHLVERGGAGECLGHAERVVNGARHVLALDAVECRAELALVAREASEAASGPREGDEAELLVAEHLVHELPHPCLRRVEARLPARLVQRGHRRRAVDQDRQPHHPRRPAAPERLHRRKDHQQEQEELEEQQQIALEPLERRVHPLIVEHLAPQEQRGHALARPPQLQEVEQHERRHQEEEPGGAQGVKPEEGHCSCPGARNVDGK